MADTTVNNESVNEVESFNPLSTGTFNSHEAALAASVVEDYDVQIKEFTEKMAADQILKTEVRNLGSDATSYASRTTTTEPDITVNSDMDVDYLVDGKTEYVAVTGAELDEIRAAAEKAGINLDDFFDSDLTVYSIRSGADQGKTAVPKALLTALADTCDKKVQEMNTNSELKMIQFQSLMDARKQALLQLSNMINSDKETLMEIIRNMKG